MKDSSSFNDSNNETGAVKNNLDINIFHSIKKKNKSPLIFFKKHWQKKSLIMLGALFICAGIYQWGATSTINDFSSPHVIHLPYYLNNKINDIVFDGQPIVMDNNIPVYSDSHFLEENKIFKTQDDGAVLVSISIDIEALEARLNDFYIQGNSIHNEIEYKHYLMRYYDLARELNHSYVPTSIKKRFASYALEALSHLYKIELAQMQASQTWAFPFQSDYEELFYQQFCQTNLLYYRALGQMAGKNSENELLDTSEKNFWQDMGNPWQNKYYFISYNTLSIL
jgi:hypothetical protein